MSYQLKATCGYEIRVIGSLCRVEKDNRIVFAGTYEACVKWLADRSVKLL